MCHLIVTLLLTHVIIEIKHIISSKHILKSRINWLFEGMLTQNSSTPAPSIEGGEIRSMVPKKRMVTGFTPMRLFGLISPPSMKIFLAPSIPTPPGNAILQGFYQL